MIGFHGCDLSVRNALVTRPDTVRKSQETFDWLGHGFYVWENNYDRALQWAEDKKQRGTLKDPSVVGVIYQLNHCLDFTDTQFIDVVSSYYQLMCNDLQVAGKDLPKNKDVPKDAYHDLVLRELDCAVIEYLHQKMHEQIRLDMETKGFSEMRYFDTARGVFTEGGPAFEGAGIQKKSHVQICIRNLNCIKGFFIPRKLARFP